jgi:hypothetical protein
LETVFLSSYCIFNQFVFFCKCSRIAGCATVSSQLAGMHRCAQPAQAQQAPAAPGSLENALVLIAAGAGIYSVSAVFCLNS